MEAGLQVLNQSAALQIDSLYVNFVLISSGVATTSVNSGFSEVWYYTEIASQRKESVIAVRCETEFVCFNSLDSNGNVVHRVLTHYYPVGFAYWIFAADPPADSGFGLEVFNAAGTRVFQASEKYMRLISYTNIPVPSGQDWSAISSRGLHAAFAQGSYCAFLEGATIPVPGGPPVSFGAIRVLTARTTRDGAQYRITPLNIFNVNLGNTDKGRAVFMMIDVTGY